MLEEIKLNEKVSDYVIYTNMMNEKIKKKGVILAMCY